MTLPEAVDDSVGVSLADVVGSIGLGDARLRAEWAGDKTTITRRCGLASSGVLAGVTYRSVELARAHERADAAEEQKHLEDL